MAMDDLPRHANPTIDLGGIPASQDTFRSLRQFSVIDKDRKSTRLNSSHGYISYAVFCLKKKKETRTCKLIRLRPSGPAWLPIRLTRPAAGMGATRTSGFRANWPPAMRTDLARLARRVVRHVNIDTWAIDEGSSYGSREMRREDV